MIDTVAQMLDAGGTRIVAYLVVASLAAVWFARERRSVAASGANDALWPSYWLLTTLVLLSMAIGRAGALGDAVAELGREQARSSGWYERRGNIQAIASSAITAIWFVSVVLAIWRVPPRRRRYLASVVSISALAAFAAVRLVSLHQIDTVLYRRDIGDIRFVAVIELFLLMVAAIAIVAVRRIPEPAADTASSEAGTANSPSAPISHGGGT